MDSQAGGLDSRPARPAFVAIGLPDASGTRSRLVAHPELATTRTVELGELGGEPLVAERDRVEKQANGDFVWSGTLRGEPLSRVTLAVRNGQLAGVVDRPLAKGGNQVLLLEPRADGGSELIESASDPTAGAGCPELLVPLPPRGRAGKDATTWPAATAANPAVVDVMIVYTPASRVRYGQSGIEGKIMQAVADANTGYQRSGVHVTLRLVHMAEVPYTETGNILTALGALLTDGDGVMDMVHQWRNNYAADLVALVGEDNNYCGISYLMGAPDVAFAPFALSVVSSGCLAYQTLHHEFGHSMGLNHDRANASAGGSYPYGYGYLRCAMDGTGVRTVMAYPCTSAFAARVNYFSTPDVLYNGRPLGISHEVNPAQSADSARALNMTAHCVAAFRHLPAPLPAAPEQLSAEAAGTAQVELAWTLSPTNVTGVRLERSLDGLGWAEVAQLPEGTVQHVDEGLAGGATYHYRARCFNSSGYSEFSNVATATTVMPPPSAPTQLTAQAVGTDRIELSWVCESALAVELRLEQSADGAAWQELCLLPANATAYTAAPLAPGATHHYRIRACNPSGCSDYSAVVTATTALLPPPSPAGLQAHALSGCSIRLEWLAVTDQVSAYRVEAADDGLTFVTLSTVAATVTTCEDVALLPGQTRHYRVCALNSGGASAPSAPAMATTFLPPAAPGQMSATVVSPAAVELRWECAGADVAGYEVERSLDGSQFAVVAVLPGAEQVWLDTAVVAGQAYSYRCFAFGPGGESPVSNVASVTVPPPPPSAPSGLAAMVAGGPRVTLSWEHSGVPPDAFELERSADAQNFLLLAIVEGGARGCEDVSVLPGESWHYRVRARNSGGVSAPTGVASVAVPLPPSAPSGLLALALSTSSVRVTWTFSGGLATGLELARAMDGGAFTVVAMLPPGTLVYEDTGLLAGRTYAYRCRAVGLGGESAWSEAAEAITPEGAAPASPSGLAVSVLGTGALRLNWSDNANNEAGFRVERSLDGVNFALLATLPPNTRQFTNSGLSAATTYYYRVCAFRIGIQSGYTAQVGATTLPYAPAAPEGLAAVASSKSVVKLTWLDRSTNETSFKVERSSDGKKFSQIATVGADVTSFTNSGLSAGKTYYFRVRAANAGGNSAYTAVATVRTPNR
jgi:hypothetical protein